MAIDYLSLLKESKYEDIELQIKEEIANGNSTSDDYYYLFLVTNKDYSNMDFDDLSNIAFFNKALELGSRKQIRSYESEFNFYKSLSKKMRELFCYACREKIDDFISALGNIKNDDLIIDQNNSDIFSEDMEHTVIQFNSIYALTLSYYLANMLYIANDKNKDVFKTINAFEIEIKALNSGIHNLSIRDSIENVKKAIKELIDELEHKDDDKNKKETKTESRFDRLKKKIIDQANKIKDAIFGSVEETNNDDIFEYAISRKTILNVKENDLYEIKIPEGITYIAKDAFKSCKDLVDLRIPTSVKEIADNAFLKCDRLRNVYYDGTLEDWCKISFSNEASNPMYFASKFHVKWRDRYILLSEIIVPKTVRTIGKFQFEGFDEIKEVEIPEGVINIDFGAFASCTNLTCIVIPRSVKRIGTDAFVHCNSIRKVFYSGRNGEWNKIHLENYYANPLWFSNSIDKELFLLDANGKYSYRGKKYKKR